MVSAGGGGIGGWVGVGGSGSFFFSYSAILYVNHIRKTVFVERVRWEHWKISHLEKKSTKIESRTSSL